MKRMAKILLAWGLVLSLAGCGSESERADSKRTEGKEEVVETIKEEVQQQQFEPMVVVDNELVKVELTELSVKGDVELKCILENKTSDMTYMYVIEDAKINGVMLDPVWAKEVAAGKKANSTISWYKSTLKDTNQLEVTDIELTFRIYDSNDWMADDVSKTTIHVYPYGENQKVRYTRTDEANDMVLVNESDMKVVLYSIDKDSFWGYALNVYLENNSDRDVMFAIDEASVNGYMCDPFWASEVSANSASFVSITWGDYLFAENGIETVEDIEMVFRMSDANTYDTILEKTVTITPDN